MSEQRVGAAKGRDRTPVRIWPRAPQECNPLGIGPAELFGSGALVLRWPAPACFQRVALHGPTSPARLRNRCASLPDVWRADANSVRHDRSDRGESDPPMSIAAATGIGEGRRARPRSGRGIEARRGSRLRLRSVSTVRGLGEQRPNDEPRRQRIESDPPQGRSARPTRSGQGRRPSPQRTGAGEA
jgi:hypothetical protein